MRVEGRINLLNCIMLLVYRLAHIGYSINISFCYCYWEIIRPEHPVGRQRGKGHFSWGFVG